LIKFVKKNKIIYKNLLPETMTDELLK
jgi:hypothetical protein